MDPQRLCLAASAATNSPRSARLPSSSPPALAQNAVLTGNATLTRCGVGDKMATALPWVLQCCSRPKDSSFSVSFLGSWDLQELGR